VELNWSTFLLEILNFLVLVWILKRFLYNPVLDTLARRKAAVEKNLSDAKALHDEAEALNVRYENRLSRWEAEKEAAKEGLRREIAGERERQLDLLEDELEREREKARALEAKRQADCLRKDQEMCLEQGARFVSRLLSEVAGPELETRLFDLALSQLETLPETRLNLIRLALEETPETAEAVTAYPLDSARRQRLAEKLGEVLGLAVSCRFVEYPALLAGVRVTLGPWVFHANLSDELKSFVEAGRARETLVEEN
jgi:F-type H+-transporting ATPase subunit b